MRDGERFAAFCGVCKLILPNQINERTAGGVFRGPPEGARGRIRFASVEATWLAGVKKSNVKEVLKNHMSS